MNLSRFATGHLKAVLFVTVILCIIGGIMLTSFPVAILPEVTFPRIKVIAEAGDRPSRMVEASITRPLEEAVATVPGVRKVVSKTERGGTEIAIAFDWSTDIAAALPLVTAKVDEVRSQLPPDAHVSAERMNATVFPILGLSLHSKTLSQGELWSLATYTLKPRLARADGVARIIIQGGRVPEIAVEIIPQQLVAYHLSLTDVEQAITQSNVVRAVGRLDRQFQTYSVVVSGEKTDPQRLGDVVVAQHNGVPVFLHQLATIRSANQDNTTIVTADGAESVLINIVRQPSANTVAVVASVMSEVNAIRKALPPGTEVGIFYDQSVLVNEAVTSVRDAVLIGAALAVVVLMLFLGNLRATLVTAVIIPATVLITFLLMRFAGLSLNLMTLGALAIGIGLVIDDAIVVVENVFRHLSEGETRIAAVQQAAHEIAAPMISSTLTTVVVFMPLVLLSGVEGAFFTALAVTLCIALMVSLVLALLVSPSLCAAFLKIRPGQKEHGRLFEKFLNLYEWVLRRSLRVRWLIVPAALAILGLAVWFGSQLKTGLMPTMDEGAFILDYLSLPGTTLAESDRLVRKVEQVLKETPEVASYSRRTGTELGFAITEPNKGDFAVILKPNRKRGVEEVMADVRKRVADEVPAGLDVDFAQILQDLIGDLEGASDPVEIKVFGENQEQIEGVAKKLQEKLDKVKGMVDSKTSVIEAGPELVIQVDPLRAGRAGMTPDMVADQANAALFGDVVTQLLQGQRQIGVRVRYPASYRSKLSQIETLPLRSPNGFALPLSAVANIVSVPGTTEIDREDQRRMVSVSARLGPGLDLGSALREVQKILKQTPMPPGVTAVLGGQFQSQKESFRNIAVVLGLAVVLVYSVMMFQFRAFTAPTVILLIMPLSLFGVTFALWWTDTPLNVSSLMGGVMLAGIVAKNGILLLDHAQKMEEEGSTVEEAVIHAGRVRLRPILMTTLTALLGLVPLALGIGAGAEMQQPLAIAVIGGLSFSTLFTLLFAPTLYVMLRRLQRRHPHRE